MTSSVEIENSEIRPFKIDVDQETFDWVNQRVKTARIIPDGAQLPNDKTWDDGTPSGVMHDLVDYWKNEYDWKKVEAKLNQRFNMFVADIEEAGEVIQLHFVHCRSERSDAVPLLFAHGWPGNFTEVESLLSLAAPEDPKQQAFHIIAPSIPGFVFSSPPKSPDFNVINIGEVYHKLMLRLGYPKYVAQGGDWGSIILRSMAQIHPDSLLAVHINMIFTKAPSLWQPYVLFKLIFRILTENEKKRLARLQEFFKQESGYSAIQGSKPQSVSYGLMDSPVGMLAWIREKLQYLAEPDYVWDKELIITWTMLYLLSNSAWHARIYKTSGAKILPDTVLAKPIPASVAFGASMFPYEVGYVPRWWAQGSVAENIIFWREQDKGGHFPSVETPDTLRADFLDFFALLSDITKRSFQSPSITNI